MSGIGTIAIAILGAGMVIGALFVVALLRAVASMQEQISQLAQRTERISLFGTDSHVPDALLTDRQGKPFQLSHLWADTHLLLYFVSVGCLACRDQLKLFSELFQEVNPTGISVCAICAGNPRMVDYFFNDAAFPPHIPGAAIDEERLVKEFGIDSTPMLAVVDTTGRVCEMFVGPAEKERLNQLFDRYGSSAIAR